MVVINTDPMAWRGAWVQTRWPNTSLTCTAWWGRDTSQPYGQHSDGGGWTQVFAPPRGYAVYVPE